MSYEALRIIWWALLGLLLIAFAVMDGFDLGTAILHPYVARTDIERRVVINSIGPVWEGNQVWFILGGGAIFAAWPALYAAAFSGFYLAMFAILAALIFRPLSIVYRSKLANPRWRAWWDWTFFVTGLVPSLIFGVAFGNVLVGVPFSFDADLRFHSDVTLLSLLNPYALLAGLVSISMIVLHGATWLTLKTEGDVAARARRVIPFAAGAFIVLFLGAGAGLMTFRGYFVEAPVITDGVSNPTLKHVYSLPYGWLMRYGETPALWFIPLTALTAALAAILFRRRPLAAFLASALICAATIATAGVTLFPFLLPSSSDWNASLTVWDASSSKLTLEIMLAAAAVFLPLIVLYTSWVYRVMRGPVKADDVTNSHGSY
jgi:cytochrome d ubiquinol oxidase subunit II